MMVALRNQKILSMMDDEIEKFEDLITEKGIGKLIIDFDITKLDLQKNAFDIGEIKYKKLKKPLSQSIINTKDKRQTTQNLF